MSEHPRDLPASLLNRPRVYLAGPEVFLRDAVPQGEKKKALCNANGLEGIFPLDVEIAAEGHPREEIALRISAANEGLIRSCAAVIANMTPFRGVSADVGTAYEMGFGCALGLAVFAYTNVSTPFTRRVELALGTGVQWDEKGCLRDSHGMAIEEWDLSDNLMLEGGVHASGGAFVVEDAPEGEELTYLGGFEKCVRLAARVLLRRGSER
jgi:nucleoside 2-deoxyribosyltransferase